MRDTLSLNRRRFLTNSMLLGLGLAIGNLGTDCTAFAAAAGIRIAVNPGIENATLTALLVEGGFLDRFGVDAAIVEAPGPQGPFDAVVSGAADICMVSGYDGLLAQIEQGAPVKIIGAGMKKAALAIFARPGVVQGLSDLAGKTVAVGPHLGLLHALVLQLFKEKGIDASYVKFIDKGSNEQCYQAVARGEADACCASVSHLYNRDGLVVIEEGGLWQVLPRYTFQMAFASDVALRDKREALVAVMAAYGALYGYLMSPQAQDAYFAARRSAGKGFDEHSASATWNFIQAQHPYATDLSLTEDDIGYRQDMDIALGELRRKQSFAEVADMSIARAAARLLRSSSRI